MFPMQQLTCLVAFGEVWAHAVHGVHRLVGTSLCFSPCNGVANAIVWQ